MFTPIPPIYSLCYHKDWYAIPIPIAEEAIDISACIRQRGRACVQVVSDSCQSYILTSAVDDPMEGYTDLLAGISGDIADYQVSKSRVYHDAHTAWWRYTLRHQPSLRTLMQRMGREGLCLHSLVDKWDYLLQILTIEGAIPPSGWYWVAWQGQLHQFMVVEGKMVVQVMHAHPTLEGIIHVYSEAPCCVEDWYMGPLGGFQEMVCSAAERVSARPHTRLASSDITPILGDKLPYRYRYRFCRYGCVITALCLVATVYLALTFMQGGRTSSHPTLPAITPATWQDIIHLIERLPRQMPVQTMITTLIFTENHWKIVGAYRAKQQMDVLAARLGPSWICRSTGTRFQAHTYRKGRGH